MSCFLQSQIFKLIKETYLKIVPNSPYLTISLKFLACGRLFSIKTLKIFLFKFLHDTNLSLNLGNRIVRKQKFCAACGPCQHFRSIAICILILIIKIEPKITHFYPTILSFGLLCCFQHPLMKIICLNATVIPVWNFYL